MFLKQSVAPGAHPGSRILSLATYPPIGGSVPLGSCAAKTNAPYPTIESIVTAVVKIFLLEICIFLRYSKYITS